MKLEPVAWQFRFKAKLAEWRGCSSGDALLYGNMAEYETRELYAIPEGYVVVPVEDVKTAYTCVGCEAIYWEDNVSCDCQVPSIDKFHEVKVIAAKEQS